MKDLIISIIIIIVMFLIGKVLSLVVDFILINPIVLIPLGLIAIFSIMKI